jgi:hypothetical protein
MLNPNSSEIRAINGYVDGKESPTAKRLLQAAQKCKKRNLQINLTRFSGSEEKAEPVLNGFTPTQSRIIQSIYKKDNNNFFCEEALKQMSGEMSPMKSFKVSPVQISKTLLKPELVLTEQPPAFNPKKVKYLKCLYSLLIKIFKQEFFCELEILPLTNLDLLILQNVLERKFHTTIGLYGNQHFVQQLMTAVTEIYSQNSAKRKEENIKFVFKWIMKRMRKSFREVVPGPPNDFRDFYKHFFEEKSLKQRISIETYYDPTNIDKHTNKTDLLYKSINTDYLRHVFECKKFRDEFIMNLDTCDVVAEFAKKLEKKIEKLLSRWDKQHLKLSMVQLEAKVHDYFKKSLRCKLPWTLKEAEQAISFFRKFVGAFELA